MNKLLVLLLLAASSYCRAQISAYSFSDTTGVFSEITGGTALGSLGSGTAVSGPLPVGFSFVFNGVSYNQVVAAADGYLSFNPTATVVPLNNLYGGAGNIRPLLAPLWDDLGGYEGYSNFSYLTTGGAGNRIFTAQWKWFAWNYSNGNTISFQVKLYEGTNKIEFLYRPEYYAPAGASASIGIAASSTGMGNFLALSDLVAAPVVSSTVDSGTVKAKPDTVRLYSFTPPPPPATDVAVSAVSIPALVCPAASLPVSVTIYNGGATPIDFSGSPATISLQVAGPVVQNLSTTLTSGSLAAGATQVVSLPSGVNVAAAGTYTFRSAVSVAADGNNGNDTLTTTATITGATSPWSERFATTALPTGWKNSGWTVGGAVSNTTITGNPGNLIYKRIGADTAGALTLLSVGPVAATDNLSFDYKLFSSASPYSLPAANWGHFKVQISTDCGTTFTTIDTIANAAATLGWDFATYPLAAYAGQYVTVRIAPKWRIGDYYLAFDNFKIKTPAATDIAIGGISTATGNCPGGSVPVTVTVRNDGSGPIDFSTTNTTITLKGTGSITQTLTTTLNSGTLAVGATRSVPMPANLNLSAVGYYYFDTYQSTPGDGDRTNDTSSSRTYVNRPTAALPWNEPFTPFSSTPTGWSTGGWNIFTYGGANGNPGYNIFKIFSTIGTLGEFYTIPVGPVTPRSILRFDHKVSASASPYGPPVPGWGFFKIQVSPGCSNVYTTIDSVTTADSGWMTKSYSLAAYAGQTVAFRIQAICQKPNYVLAFDNFQVSDPPATDLAATSLTVPAGQCPLPAAPVTFGFKNVGTTTVDFGTTPANITVNIGGVAPQTLTAVVDTGTLAPLASRTVAMPLANLAAPGTYTFKGNIWLAADANRNNDTATAATITIASVTTVAAPWLEGFAATTLPTGWTAPGWSVGTIRGATGNPGNNMYKRMNGGSPEGVITSSAIGPLPAASYLAFDYKISEVNGTYYPATSGFGNFKVQISSNCGGSFFDLENVTTADKGWTRKTYSLAAYAGQQVILRIAATNLYTDYDYAFDNFRVYTLSAADLSVTALSLADYVCPVFDVPIGLMIKNNGPNTFDFGKSIVSATIKALVPVNNPPGVYEDSFTTVISSDSILPNDYYFIHFTKKADVFYPGTYLYKCYITVNPLVDANRNNDTLAETRISGSAVPWAEPFATTNPPTILTNGWLVGAERGATGNPGYNLYRTLNADSSNQPFQTKTLGYISSGQYLRFDYKVSSTAQPYGPPPAGWGNFKVQLSRDCNSFVTVDSITTAGMGWVSKSYPLSNYVGNNVRLQITPMWKAGSYDLAFDNFRINVPGTCAAPSGYTDQRTDTSVRVHITGNNGNTIIEYGPFGFTPGTGGTAGGGTVVTTTASSTIINGLLPGTGYVFCLRQNCTATGEGYSSNQKIDSFVTSSPLIPMTNDLPANAIRLTVGAGCRGLYTHTGATQSSGEPAVSCSGSLTGGKIVWFKFAAPPTGFVKVSTDALGNTLRDTKAALFSATDSSNFSTFQIIACDDDNGVLSDGASIFYATGLVPGGSYYVAVDGFSTADTGRFCMQVAAVDSNMIAASGSCANGQQLPEHLASYRGWLSATNYSGQLTANLRSNSTLPGSVSYYPVANVHTDSVRKAATGEYYLDRNFTIINNFPTTPGNWDVQFFFLNKEMRALQAVSSTATLTNLNVTRGKDSLCRGTFLNGSADSLLLQTTSGSANGVSWLTVSTSKLANFFLHPGMVPLPRLYVFTGSGAWSNPANWSGGIVPPVVLPPNSAVEIKPSPGGQCILDVNQRISGGDRLRIMSGTNVVIPGSVIIQQ